MIVLNKDKSNIHRIYVSKSRNSISDVFQIKLIGCSTKKEYILNAINEQKNTNYFVFTIDIKDLELGEYKVEVLDVCKSTEKFDKIASTILMRIQTTNNNKSFENSDEAIYYEA